MRRLVALIVVGLMLAVPAVSAASWTQTGYDAARTGAVPEGGPAEPDVALQVKLPGSLATDWTVVRPGPLVQNGSAYVPLKSFEMDGVEVEERGGGMQGVVKVDLDTGEIERFLALGELQFVRSIATDGTYLFVSIRDWPDQVHVEAYRLSDGEKAWTWGPHYIFGESDTTLREASIQSPNAGAQGCAHLMVHGGNLFHFCNQLQEETRRQEAYIVSLNAETGEENWLWESTNPRNGETDPRPTIIGGISLVGEHLLVSGFQLTGQAGAYGCLVDDAPAVTCEEQPRGASENGTLRLRAFDPASKELLWTYDRGISSTEFHAAGQELQGPNHQTFTGMTAHATGTANVVYVRMLDKVFALNPGQDGAPIWSGTVGEKDAQTNATFGGFALGEGSLYATSTETLYRFDTEPHHNRWRTVLDPSYNEKWANGDLVLAEDTLYAAAEWRDGNGTSIYAVDTATGDIEWRKPIPSDPEVANQKSWRLFHYFSVAEGDLVAAGGDGTLWVFGETNASLEPRMDASATYPETGEQVQVNLSETEPGVHGNATRFRATWGDGTDTGWQSNPVLTHTYDTQGDLTARFVVANDANQTASTTQTFHVGQEAPTEPNWIEERFEKDNQDMTFGVLGVALALGGGVVGVARRRRKKSILQEELETLEEGFEETKDNPGECEAFLDTRKARARSLMMDGTLDEEQFGVIESRVEELARKLRTSMLDERFQFLPYGLVQSLKKMLADGKISSWERDAVETLLEDEEALSEAQREKVRHQLDRWLVEDTGGEAA